MVATYDERQVQDKTSMEVMKKILKMRNPFSINITKEMFSNKLLYELKNVNYRILKNIDLKIYQGEYIAIIGKNGNGKSTLMNLLQKLYIAQGQKIKFLGKDFNKIKNEDFFKYAACID